MAIDPVNREGLEQLLRRACREVERRVRAGDELVAEFILGSHPELAADPEMAIDLIYTEYVTREELGQNPSSAALVARFPQWSSRLERLLDVDAALGDVHQESLTVFPKSTWNSSPTSITTHRSSSPNLIRKRIGQYEILQEIGRGGMGVVYRARQLGLNRIVALKVIQAEEVSAGQQSRFQTEAMAIAQMQHPNIVRVIEIGQEDDTHFISLEFAAEGSLDRKLLSGTFAIRTAAEAVETLARAVDYAHEMGIVHRDLKPANVLIAADGALKVADFGLAKWYLGPAADQTQSGALLGTPCYMAPEQAGGRADQIGPATDIYALGVVLYELLTGKPPFMSDSALQTLERIRTEEPSSPCRSRKSVPRDLETICLRCLQKDPRRRFPTAGELANDLRRFLDHEPIQSRRIGLHEKGWRWVRRHAVVTGLASAMLVMGLVGSAFLILNRWQIDHLSTDVARSGQRIKETEQLAAVAKSEAEATLSQATEFADRLSRHGQDLMRIPGLTEIGQRSLDQVLVYHEGLLKKKPNDSQVQRKAADAYLTVGSVLRDRGKYELGEKHIRQGVALWAAIKERHPENVRDHSGLANAILQLANVYRMRQDDVNSHIAYGQAIAMYDELIAKEPTNRIHKLRQSLAYLNFAVPLRNRGKLQAAEKELLHAVVLAWSGIEAVIKDARKPVIENWNPQREMAALMNATVAPQDVRRLPDIQHLRQLPQTTLSRILKEGWATNLALGYEDLASVWKRQRHLESSDRAFNQAFELRQLIVMYDGPRPEHLDLLARSHWNLAWMQFKNGMPLEAEVHLRQSIDLWSGLMTDYPQWTSYPNHISVAQIVLGKSLRLRGLYETSEQQLKLSVNRYERLFRESQATAFMRFGLSEARRELALTVYEQGRVNEAIYYLEQALRCEPLNMLALYDLAWCLELVPDSPFRRTQGSFPIATKSLEAAARMRDKLLADGTLKSSRELDRALRRTNRGNNYDRLLQAYLAWQVHRPVRAIRLLGRVVQSVRSSRNVNATPVPPATGSQGSPVLVNGTNGVAP